MIKGISIPQGMKSFNAMKQTHSNNSCLNLSKLLIHLTGCNYACAGEWPVSCKKVIAENKMAPLLQYFVLMAIIVSIEVLQYHVTYTANMTTLPRWMAYRSNMAREVSERVPSLSLGI